jgi:hypothetical protein
VSDVGIMVVADAMMVRTSPIIVGSQPQPARIT